MSSRIPLRSDVFQRPPTIDIVVTVVFVILGVGLMFVGVDDRSGVRGPDVLGISIVLASTLPLLFRRSAPVDAGIIGAVAALSFTIWAYSAPLTIIVMGILVYSAAAYGPLAGSIVVTLLHTAVAVIYLMAYFSVGDIDVAVINGIFSAVGFSGLWAIGRSVRGRRLYLRELEERTVRLERARDAEVRAALAEERSRIARELHDVVAHHVSVMTVQSAGARRSIQRDQERAAEAMSAVEATGRAALTEMRRIVGVLRGPDGSVPEVDPERSPQPGLTELDMLVDQFRTAGLPVQVKAERVPDELPVGVDLTAFRIIQEALTNTIKHAGPSSATVHVGYEPDAVLVRISDDGRGLAAALDGRQPGHGLLGMRERVALYGGTLTVGPRRDGGFDVRARIPFDPIPAG